MKKPVKLRQCHAGPVTCLESSPVSGLLLSGGEDGRVCVYDLDRGSMVNSVRYSAGVSCMLWLPLQLDRSGSQLIIGFTDGVIRLYWVASDSSHGSSLMKLMKSLSVRMKLLQALKPHRTGVTALSLAPKHRLLASAGRDRTVYLYRLSSREGVFQLEPLGYFQLEATITSIAFRRECEAPELLVALGSESLLLLQLASLPEVGAAALALPLEEHCAARAVLPGTLCIPPKLELLSATYRQDRPGAILLLHSSTTASQLTEVTLVESGELELAAGGALTLPAPPRRATLSRVRLWLQDRFLLLGYSNGVFRVVDLQDPAKLSTWTQVRDPVHLLCCVSTEVTPRA
jgi:WD40 repeat protein